MKNLSYRPRITQDTELARYPMPTLKDAYVIGGAVDLIEREAYEKGYEAGEKAGFEMGEQKAQVLIDKLETLLADVATLTARIAKKV